MSFLNSAILAGLAFTVVPIVLHFLLKQKPKRLAFPALRLIQERRRQSVRRMRLKHFWLMLLRILVFAIIVFAIARPSLPPANYNLTGLEIGVLCATVITAVVAYFFFRSRLQKQPIAKYQLEEKQSKLRTTTTVAALLAIAAFVGFPYQQRIAGELIDPRPVQDINLPVAGIMLFDTSLSMSYLQEGKTALDQAREIATEHLQSLPAGSRIAIADNANDNPILFQSTMLSAQTRLDGLEIHSSTLPLDDRLQKALKAHQDDRTRTLNDQSGVQTDARKDRYIRRIYIFTDLAKSGWKERGSDLLKSMVEETKGTNLYFIDVGQEDPQNIAITDVQLSRERIPLDGDLIVSTTLVATGSDVESQRVDLKLQNSQRQVSKVGQVELQLDSGVPVQASFPTLSDITNRAIHGEVRLATSDPLEFDNVRYFSAEVIPKPEVLVVGPTYADVNEWILGLAPLESAQAGQNTFEPKYVPIGKLKEQELSDYAAVTLINCRGFANDDIWFQLSQYVENGGGLIIVLGATDTKLDPAKYNRPRAQVFLPATLEFYQSDIPDASWQFSIDDREHAMFWKFRQLENYGTFATIENLVQVQRFWKLDLAADARVLATYNDADRSAAIVERGYGRGRTVMLTTGTRNEADDRNEWSSLASPFDMSWVFVAFVEQMTEYVSRFTDVEHNFLCGQNVVIPLEPKNSERTIYVRQPELKQTRKLVEAQETSLKIEDVQDVGHYDLYEQNARNFLRGFSVNPPSKESDLTRFAKQDLDERFGEDKYEIAQDINELKDDINAADIGQEVYPMLLMLVVVIFLGEHIVANRFYGGHENAADA